MNGSDSWIILLVEVLRLLPQNPPTRLCFHNKLIFGKARRATYELRIRYSPYKTYIFLLVSDMCGALMWAMLNRNANDDSNWITTTCLHTCVRTEKWDGARAALPEAGVNDVILIIWDMRKCGPFTCVNKEKLIWATSGCNVNTALNCYPLIISVNYLMKERAGD